MTLQGSRITFHAVSFWASMAALLALACVLVVAGNSTVLWSAPIALCIFFSGSWLLMKRTQTRLTELTPLSWSLLVFFIQLVLIPLLILMSEPAVGTLRVLPSPTSINYGLLLSTFAFCAFVLGFSLRHRTELRRTHLIRAEWKPPLHIALSFIVMGLLGFYLYSVGSPSLSLLMDPKLARQVARSAETGFSEASATFLRPFFVAGLVLLWIRATHSGLCRTLPMKIGGAGLVAVLTVLAMSTYSFNRASIVVPIVSMAAVLTSRYRMPVALFWAGAILAIVPLWTVGSFRKSGSQASDYVDGIRDFSANEPVRQLSEGIQLYGGGPQFVGYLLEQQAEEPLYWGSTLIASALAPVPVVGRDFRYSSGTAIYNYMIYGSTTSADQVVPFSGELLMNFHLPGVLVGFALLGACLAWVHGLFRSSSSAADTYFCQYTGIWLSFLITGSLLVLAQIAFYMCLPMYVWLAIRQVVRPRQRLVFMRVPTPVGVRG